MANLKLSPKQENSQQAQNFGPAGYFYSGEKLPHPKTNDSSSTLVLDSFILSGMVLMQTASILDEGIDGFDQANFQTFSIKAVSPERRE
jgi:hypothetical protein